MSDRIQRRTMFGAIRTAMNDVLKPALVRASPVGTTKRKTQRKTRGGVKIGPIRKAWLTKLVKTGSGVHLQLVPISKTYDAYYAKYIEFGWLAGRRISKKEFIATREAGRKMRRRTPVPAKPFAKPAADATFASVVDRVGTELAGRIETVMRGINQRG
jgi:hypothetical protein